ncbi:phytanoyl-CoA dioxygenase family protein [Undibacterium sp. SXout11W]|uniref:phytanoyl-CoA dioxygenase family protein n=1 Tax=Undibacterium sp. SXout11W TaxID=3413050 RepID=UPI003BF3F835
MGKSLIEQVLYLPQMNSFNKNFHDSGFNIVSPFLNQEECLSIGDSVAQLKVDSIGTRNLLDLPWCQNLVSKIRSHDQISLMLPVSAVAVQCTYFEKSKDQNWLVSIHQDLSIPVKEKVDHPDLIGWTEKEGTTFVQPPSDVLNQLVAVRVHIDECGHDDGPLRLVAGSHNFGRLGTYRALSLRDELGETTCPVPIGGVLLMNPLVLHASSKSIGNSKRRVLHFVFGPPDLPFGLKWKSCF